MQRLFFVLTLCFLTLGACRTSKKSAPSKPKPKPNTATSTKPPSSKPNAPTTPKPPAPTKPAPNPESQLVFAEGEYLQPVLERAQKEKKIVFVEFSASWCAPCKVMEEEVLSKKPTFTYLNKNFINFKVDADSPNGKTISAIYEVRGLPTVLFLDPQGVVLERKMGIASHTNLTMMGDLALQKYKK